ncbi:hypothetical protein EXIGLDRAFT_390715 [Exidia glandulosa HHB12029]|uniref:F-box domain-containing protein n=1 Tax=Exidia glandulosa HHB12029 TaxID=1314781 RepID=A0A165KZP2_EXIGL|nr:hypothetical protein EXIGLDRAFT_390715 [Exidia glandulosa HHB12029]
MSNSMLTFKERHGLTTLLHLTVQAVLDRTSESPGTVQRVVNEIRDVMDGALRNIASEHAPANGDVAPLPPTPVAASSAVIAPNGYTGAQYSAPGASVQAVPASSSYSPVPVVHPAPLPPARQPAPPVSVPRDAPAPSLRDVPLLDRFAAPRTPGHVPTSHGKDSGDTPSTYSSAPYGRRPSRFDQESSESDHRRRDSSASSTSRWNGPPGVYDRPSSAVSPLTKHNSPPTPTPRHSSGFASPVVIKREPKFSPTLIPREPPLPDRSRVEASTPRANGQALVPRSTPRASRFDAQQPKFVRLVSDEVWSAIFQYLAPRETRFTRGPKFVDLVRASHVCSPWRRIILHCSNLWSTLRALSVGELEHIDDLFQRTGNAPVDVDIDFFSTGRLDYKRLATTLTHHMHHIQKLSLRLHPARMAAWFSIQPVLGTRAPMLEKLLISFPGGGVVLPIMLFNMHAPRLFTVSAHMQLLPAGCPAFSQVMHFASLDEERNPLEEETRRLMEICPQLDSLTLNAPLLDAPLNDGYKGSREYFRSLEEHYGGRRLLKQLQVMDRGERESPPRPGTDREAHNGPPRIRLVVPTLQLFQHIDIPTVHIVQACNDTFKFINRRMGTMRHVGFVTSIEGQDSQMVLIDDANRARVFSRASATFFNTALRKTDMFKDIVSLAIGDFGLVQDWTELFSTPVPSLETLTIIVSPPRTVPPQFIHVFEVAKTNRWSCASLRGLRFSAKEPLIDLGPPNGSPLTISASAALVFLRRGLLLRTSQLPELFLDGVVFAEGGAGPEVEELKQSVSRLVLRR